MAFTGKRTVPMQVLCLSPSKTGTSSVRLAMEKLGYIRTHHGFDLFDDEPRCAKWFRLVQAKFGPGNGVGSVAYEAVDWKEAFDDVLGDCMACADTPIYMFWQELVRAYPEAKVVLVERDVESWFESFSRNVTKQTFAPIAHLLIYYVEPILGSHMARVQSRAYKGYWGGQTAEEVDAVSRMKYKLHFQQIRDAVPKERLLDFDLKQGWQPLCHFLEKPVPDEEFPKVNEREEYDRKVWAVQKAMLVSVGPWLLWRALPATAVGIAWWVYRR